MSQKHFDFHTYDPVSAGKDVAKLEILHETLIELAEQQSALNAKLAEVAEGLAEIAAKVKTSDEQHNPLQDVLFSVDLDDASVHADDLEKALPTLTLGNAPTVSKTVDALAMSMCEAIDAFHANEADARAYSV